VDFSKILPDPCNSKSEFGARFGKRILAVAEIRKGAKRFYVTRKKQRLQAVIFLLLNLGRVAS